MEHFHYCRQFYRLQKFIAEGDAQETDRTTRHCVGCGVLTSKKQVTRPRLKEMQENA